MQAGMFKQYQRKGRSVLRMRPALSSYWGSMAAAGLVLALWVTQRAIFQDFANELGLPGELAGIGLALGLVPIIIRVLYHRFTHAYEIEDGRTLRVIEGFVARQKREFPLTDKVQTDIVQSVAGRLLNFGTIAFWTGDDRSRLEWRNAPDPDRVVSYLDHLKHGAKPNSEQGSGLGRGVVSQAPEPHGPTGPTLKEAKSTKYTHFGTNVGQFKTLAEMVGKRIETPFGAYIDNDDGTVSHQESGLMWARAPWGMVWNGESFTGEPIKLKWREAAGLFGTGADVGYNVGSSMAYFDQAKREASAFENGYKKGRCLIHFAGYKDWRLPTAAELDHLVPYAHTNSRDGSPISSAMSTDDRYKWHSGGEASKAIAERLYPEFSKNRINLWTATGAGGNIAWAFDGGLPVGDMQIDVPMGMMFVRRVLLSDLMAKQVVEETISI